MEYLIDAELDGDPLPYFIAAYPSVTFVRHHTMNGFYFRDGTRADLLSVRDELREMERTGKIPPVPSVSTVPIAHLAVASALRQLKLQVDGVDCTGGIAGEVLLYGEPESRHRAAQALKEIDLPSVWLKLSREQLARLSGGICELPRNDSREPFDCPQGDCGGPLHTMGLRQGDVILWSRKPLPGGPLWVVSRKGLRTNVYVDFY